MKKEEILEKSRQENKNKDIVELEAINKACGIAIIVGLSVCCVINILSVFLKESMNYESLAIYLSIMGTLFLVKYIKLRRKHELLIAILFLLLSAFSLVIILKGIL
jgi:hypothetical protein